MWMNNVYILTSAQNMFKYYCKTPCDPIVKPSLMIQYNVSYEIAINVNLIFSQCYVLLNTLVLLLLFYFLP